MCTGTRIYTDTSSQESEVTSGWKRRKHGEAGASPPPPPSGDSQSSIVVRHTFSGRKKIRIASNKAMAVAVGVTAAEEAGKRRASSHFQSRGGLSASPLASEVTDSSPSCWMQSCGSLGSRSAMALIICVKRTEFQVSSGW